MRPADTSPEAWAVFLGVMRTMAPEEKSARAFELSQEARGRAEEAIRARYPNADEVERLHRYARATLGEDLFVRAYGNVLAGDHDPPPFDIEELQDEVFRLSGRRVLAQVRAE